MIINLCITDFAEIIDVFSYISLFTMDEISAYNGKLLDLIIVIYLH